MLLSLAALLGQPGSPSDRSVRSAVAATRPARVRYNNTILPQTFTGGPEETFHQQFAMVNNSNYGLHVFARGANSSIWHKFQTSWTTDESGGYPMSGWLCMTYKNGTTSDGTHPLIFWNDPVAALNHDGRAELFVRIQPDLDVWQMYQTDANDPMAWAQPRGPLCLCNFPPCANQSKCGVNGQCDNLGVDCIHANPNDYWSDHTGWPTANMNTFVDKDGLISLVYRGFDGRMYVDVQAKAGNSTTYTSGKVYLYNSLFE